MDCSNTDLNSGLEELSSNHDTALYFLYLTKEKLNSDNMKKLKCLLFYILKRIKKNLIIEVYLDEKSVNVDFSTV